MSEADSQREEQDEYFLDTPLIRAFIDDVRRAIDSHHDVSAALDALRLRFAELLSDPSWLPDEFAVPYAASGMGGGIGSWVLFRAGDRSLSLFSLVVPPGSETPVHDHLAWGYVGLYRGEQLETVYERQNVDASAHHADPPPTLEPHHHELPEERVVLTVAKINELQPGSFYKLLPPDGDIHSVKTTSAEASVSIHLLANDTGCVIRHAFDPEHATVRAFRSGYSNVACEDSTYEE
jgi:predicted metal-dependent enzyme (double-stranded beta helix superfamily)